MITQPITEYRVPMAPPAIRLTPYTPPFEESRWYLCAMERGGTQCYHAAHHEDGRWIDGNDCDLTDEGWRLVAISEELPLLQPGPPPGS